MGKRVLILEGGGMRAAFSCGVLNALHHLNVTFDEVVGVSSGAVCGLFYQSGQCDILRTLFLDFADSRIFGLQALLCGQGLFDLEALMGKPVFHERFDEEAFWQNPARFYVSLTRVADGASVLMEKSDFHNRQECFEAIMASASLPLLARPKDLRGVAYMDGGISNSIPLAQYENTDDRLLVVHTQPSSYRKRKNLLAPLLYFPFRKHPLFYTCLKSRPQRYNRQLDVLDNRCDAGRAFVLQPAAHRVGRYTQSRKAIFYTYIDGYYAAMRQKEALLRFLNDAPDASSEGGANLVDTNRPWR